MKIRFPEGKFVTSASRFSQLPESNGAEFCLMGRSNVGKSSFINHVMGDGRLARVSNSPGKTVLANLYSVGEDFAWVDLPGYGYAKASKSEKNRISGLISDYCSRRVNLSGIIWLLDIRHPGAKADLEAATWFSALNIPVLPVLTKCDKFSRNKIPKQVKQYMSIFSFSEKPLMYSIVGESSRTNFWESWFSWTGKNRAAQ